MICHTSMCGYTTLDTRHAKQILNNDRYSSGSVDRGVGVVRRARGGNFASLLQPPAFLGAGHREHAKHFFGLSDIDRHVAVHDDESEWRSWRNRGDPVLHIELGKWADMLLIAPLDANTLAKTAQGLCDNLVTCVMRAWDLQKPLLFCPAMNTRMWEHPLTNEQIQKLVNWGYKQIPPIKKTLMCGDTGVGAMAEVVDIVSEVKLAIEQHVRRHE
ncbi:Phosphopantothenoylcysteine decarboxylase [Eumeta japonica]|uniref:Phosphopantothenoylcysteine decarboxylase n=1 Tax=Eumeta variegata TaxID=151549 RepID=A0A4C1U539_EUMVA|nr:Phosphopantothenoylcysteine decarboxylase [Eumeta japonica]